MITTMNHWSEDRGIDLGSSKNNGWAIASLITGILAILPFFGLLMAFAAVITGYFGQKRAKQRWMAIVGMVLGILVIILYILGMITGMINRIIRTIGL